MVRVVSLVGNQIHGLFSISIRKITDRTDESQGCQLPKIFTPRGALACSHLDFREKIPEMGMMRAYLFLFLSYLFCFVTLWFPCTIVFLVKIFYKS